MNLDSLPVATFSLSLSLFDSNSLIAVGGTDDQKRHLTTIYTLDLTHHHHTCARSNNEVRVDVRKTNRRASVTAMLRLTPGPQSMLAHGFAGRLRPRPPHFEVTRIGPRTSPSSAGAGTNSIAQELA